MSLRLRGQLLATMSKTGPRFVLHLGDSQILNATPIYKGAEFRNQIILFDRATTRPNHMTNPDLLSAAKRYAAAMSLAGNDTHG